MTGIPTAALIACALVTIPAVGGSALGFLPFIMSFASYGLTRAWHWITTIAALVVAGLAIREGIEAWRGDIESPFEVLEDLDHDDHEEVTP